MKTRVALPFLWLAVAASAISIGCIKEVRSTVPAFAQAAELTSSNVQAAFTTVNNAYLQAQQLRYVVTYDGTVSPFTISEEWLPPEALNVRLQVLQGLKQYASELNSLTGSNDFTDLNKASTAAGTGLTALISAEPFKTWMSGLPSNTASEGATAVDALGNWLIEMKLKKNLPAQIEKMDPTIQSLCVLFVEDIGTVQADDVHPSKGSGLRHVLWIQYNSIIKSQNQYILHGQCQGERPPLNCFTPDARFAQIQKLPALVDQWHVADRTLQQVAVTVKQLAQAHSELVKATRTKQDLRADLGDLLAEVQRLSAYYSSLSNNK